LLVAKGSPERSEITGRSFMFYTQKLVIRKMAEKSCQAGEINDRSGSNTAYGINQQVSWQLIEGSQKLSNLWQSSTTSRNPS
jgi:hypothetical protein